MAADPLPKQSTNPLPLTSIYNIRQRRTHDILLPADLEVVICIECKVFVPALLEDGRTVGQTYPFTVLFALSRQIRTISPSHGLQKILASNFRQEEARLPQRVRIILGYSFEYLRSRISKLLEEQQVRGECIEHSERYPETEVTYLRSYLNSVEFMHFELNRHGSRARTKSKSRPLYLPWLRHM